MKPITELYHFEKFWAIYSRQNRGVSTWDDKRTDMETFLLRTMAKWFVGKCYQIEIERHKDRPIIPFDKQPTEYAVFTKYVHIVSIRFGFTPYREMIDIEFIEPHSEKIEKVCYGRNEFMRIKLFENEGDFRLLKKFYPIRKEVYKLALLPNFPS